METLFLCKECHIVMACSNVFSQGVQICHGDYAMCKIREHCHVKDNPQLYLRYRIIEDGYCDKCWEEKCSQGRS